MNTPIPQGPIVSCKDKLLELDQLFALTAITREFVFDRTLAQGMALSDEEMDEAAHLLLEDAYFQIAKCDAVDRAVALLQESASASKTPPFRQHGFLKEHFRQAEQRRVKATEKLIL